MNVGVSLYVVIRLPTTRWHYVSCRFFNFQHFPLFFLGKVSQKVFSYEDIFYFLLSYVHYNMVLMLCCQAVSPCQYIIIIPLYPTHFITVACLPLEHAQSNQAVISMGKLFRLYKHMCMMLFFLKVRNLGSFAEFTLVWTFNKSYQDFLLRSKATFVVNSIFI